MKKLLLLLFIVTIVGCAKDGETGPAGSSGVANIQTIFINDQHFSEFNMFLWKIEMNVPQISGFIRDEGVVLVYRKVTNGWDALPNTEFDVTIEREKVIIITTNSAYGTFVPFDFKITIIPPVQ